MSTQNMTSLYGVDIINANLKRIEQALRKKVNKETLVVKDIKCTQFLEKGDSALGNLLSVRVTTQADDTTEEYCTVVKLDFPANSKFGRSSRAWSLFSREINAYRRLFTEMEKYQISKGIQPKHFSTPTFIAGDVADDTETSWFMMNDLRRKGYKMADIREGLDFDHCKLVMVEHAKFHALTLALKDGCSVPQLEKRFDISLSETILSVDFFKSLGDLFVNAFNVSLKLSAEAASSDGNLIDKAKRMRVDTWQELLNLFKEELFLEEPFATICLRDSNCRNLLFEYGQNERENFVPTSVKCVDFQMLSYQMPTLDLTTFLYSATTLETRERHLGKLAQIYYESFMHFVKQLEFDFPAYSYEQFAKHFQKSRLLGIFLAMAMLPGVLVNPEDVPEFSDKRSRDENIRDTALALEKSGRVSRIADLFYEAHKSKLV